jgi:hypothetical protein
VQCSVVQCSTQYSGAWYTEPDLVAEGLVAGVVADGLLGVLYCGPHLRLGLELGQFRTGQDRTGQDRTGLHY